MRPKCFLKLECNSKISNNKKKKNPKPHQFKTNFTKDPTPALFQGPQSGARTLPALCPPSSCWPRSPCLPPPPCPFRSVGPQGFSVAAETCFPFGSVTDMTGPLTHPSSPPFSPLVSRAPQVSTLPVLAAKRVSAISRWQSQNGKWFPLLCHVPQTGMMSGSGSYFSTTRIHYFKSRWQKHGILWWTF